MIKSFLLAVFLVCFCMTSWSQADTAHRDRQGTVRNARPANEARDDSQQRREAVRAALAAAREQKSENPADRTPTRRKLSAEERQLLRDQLRQQRQEALESQRHPKAP